MSYFINRDRIQMGSSSSGTGNLILTYSVSGYQNLQSVSATTTNNQIYYSVSDGVNFEIGIGRFVAFGERPPNVPLNSTTAVLIRDEVLESSANTNALINFSSAIKNVSLVFPANVTLGSAATGDNSSVGTNLNAWNNLKKELYRGTARGNPFDNRGVGGIISTYSILASTSLNYKGGVLQPNGDLHFIQPETALVAPQRVGQKINVLSGVVSTYSLVYTTSSDYVGGVLSPNGDAHFVPNDARVGQKISINGVISTYSLVYTADAAYAGGVLAPNGDVHFVPYSANRGQKVSAAGVVSTYSLVFTASFAYIGGVLAPNGDIHFVPQNSARVGQKISAAGVVSTYSLVYTNPIAYAGGFLAPNGDIHFIPNQADVGMKISTGINVPMSRCVSPFFNKH